MKYGVVENRREVVSRAKRDLKECKYRNVSTNIILFCIY